MFICTRICVRWSVYLYETERLECRFQWKNLKIVYREQHPMNCRNLSICSRAEEQTYNGPKIVWIIAMHNNSASSRWPPIWMVDNKMKLIIENIANLLIWKAAFQSHHSVKINGFGGEWRARYHDYLRQTTLTSTQHIRHFNAVYSSFVSLIWFSCVGWALNETIFVPNKKPHFIFIYSVHCTTTYERWWECVYFRAYHVNCCGINSVIISNYRLEWALCSCELNTFDK